MPPKRRTGVKAASPSDADDNTKPKKRRVSLACDACRAAREKCDGAKPRCCACATLNRSCSYTPASKKRGVQSGYLRTIELSLAWLLHNIPDAEVSLRRVLQQPTTAPEIRALLGKGSNGRHLQDTWNQSQVRIALESLLSATPAASVESADEEPTTEGTRPGHLRDAAESSTNQHPTAIVPGVNQESTNASVPDQSSASILRLPAQWKRLLSTYTSDTHCWLPIMDPDALQSLAASYGINGVQLDVDGSRSILSHHAELWAALAIGSFHNPAYTDENTVMNLNAVQIFRIARSLVPEEDDTYDISSIRAMILHSIIFIGRGKTLTASLLLGKVGRILSQLQVRNVSLSRSTYQQRNLQVDTVYIACSFLDALSSLSFSQPGNTELNGTVCASFQALAELSAFGQTGQTASSASMPAYSDAASQAQMQPIQTLLQLYAFTTVLTEALTHWSNQTGSVGPEKLVHKLDSRFNFCNSLIPGGASSITVPTALVKLVFLTASMYLAPHLRSSLLPGFLETVEACFNDFGPSRTPPLVPLLFQILQKQAGVDGDSESEHSNWQQMAGKLQNIWSDTPANKATESRAQRSRINDLQSPQEERRRRLSHTQSTGGQAFMLAQTDSLSPIVARDVHEAQSRLNSQIPLPNPAGRTNSNAFYTGHSNDRGGHGRPFLADGNQKDLQFDYDALFADLGSIGHLDSVEMDTQLMTNLGFAPDCDLTEMFQSDYGL